MKHHVRHSTHTVAAVAVPSLILLAIFVAGTILNS